VKRDWTTMEISVNGVRKVKVFHGGGEKEIPKEKAFLGGLTKICARGEKDHLRPHRRG